jgi:O-antigen biosynthesis protein WbqV
MGIQLPLGRRAVTAFVHDVAMAAVSFPLALWLRLGDHLMEQAGSFLLPGTALFAGVAALVFLLLGLYRGVWRYASLSDLIAILRAVTLVILVYLPVMFLLSRLQGMPRSALAINWFVLAFLLGAPRFLYRVLKDRGFNHLLERQSLLRTPVLLAGFGDAADSFIREMARDPHAPFLPVGLLDLSGRRTGQSVRGVPVLGDLAGAPAALARLARRGGPAPQRLIVALEHLPRRDLAALLELAERHGMTLAQLPPKGELRRHDGEPARVRPVAVEDLLGRPQAVLDRAPMARLVAGRRVLVTGAGGSIGSELVRQLAGFAPARLVLLDHSEALLYGIDGEVRRRWPALAVAARLADVRDRGRLERLLGEERPELVFHAAALKHVPITEQNPAEAVLTNALGTRNLAEACRRAGVAAMVLISTDKAVNPVGMLGVTKRLAESYCQALDIVSQGAGQGAGQGRAPRFLTVRFGNVLGSTGSVVPLFERQIAEGGPLTVTHPEVTRFFMTVREAVELVLQATALGLSPAGAGELEPGGIFVLDMGEPVRILELARQMIRLSGKRPEKDIAIVFTGLRPGEKLAEEIFHPREATLATGIPGVLLARPRTADYGYWSRAFAALAETLESGSEEQLRDQLRRLVPDYAGEPVPARSASA